MLPEVELEVLLFSTRYTLDAYQLVSAKSNQMIQRNNDKLARRLINKLQVNECYEVESYCSSHAFDGFMHDSFVYTTEYEQTALRMRNSFISEISVYCMPCAGFLPWLHANPGLWSDCRAEGLRLGNLSGHRHHPHAIPDSELVPVIDDLTVSKLCLPLRHTQDHRKAQQLVSQALSQTKLKSLELDLSKLYPPSADFVDFVFNCNQLERVDICLYFNMDPFSYGFVDVYILKFIGADVFARIVPLVTIRVDGGDGPPARPAVCERALRTSTKASAFFDELRASCKLYEFKNAARKEMLQVYSGSAHRQKAHFFCLQTEKLE